MYFGEEMVLVRIKSYMRKKVPMSLFCDQILKYFDGENMLMALSWVPSRWGILVGRRCDLSSANGLVIICLTSLFHLRFRNIVSPSLCSKLTYFFSTWFPKLIFQMFDFQLLFQLNFQKSFKTFWKKIEICFKCCSFYSDEYPHFFTDVDKSR